LLKVSVIHGPNLNLLGSREPRLYGSKSLEEINLLIKKKSGELGFFTEIFQSNLEGEIVSRIHKIKKEAYDYLIINAAAYTHTSLAIRDAISGTGVKTIEVHLTNIHQREAFRHKSFITDLSIGQISGFGYLSYILALEALANF